MVSPSKQRVNVKGNCYPCAVIGSSAQFRFEGFLDKTIGIGGDIEE